MKYLITFTVLAFYAAIISGCSKNNDYNAGTDHTSGMIKVRKWSGTTNGNCKLDSPYYDTPTHSTKHAILLKHYSRTITDSMFSVEKYNDFTIKVFGNWMRYRSTDSIGTKLVVYDTTYSGSPLSFVKYNFSDQGTTLELHKMYEHDETTNEYFQDHWYLHTVD